MIHVFSVGTNLADMTHLRRSVEISGLDIDIVQKFEWSGYMDKITNIISLIKDIPEDDIVCVVDAYDVVSFSDKGEIFRKFKETDCRILISSELNLYPEKYRPYYDRIYNNRTTSPSRSLYNYVNSGGYVGYKSALMEMFSWKSIDEIRAICDDGGDQNYFTEYFINNIDTVSSIGNSQVKLDTKQSIFQSMYKVEYDEFEFMSGRLFNKVLKTFPCFAHFNGYGSYNMKVVHKDTGVSFDVRDVFISAMETTRLSRIIESLRFQVPFKIVYNGIEYGNMSQTESKVI